MNASFGDRFLIYSDAETERRTIYGSTCMVGFVGHQLNRPLLRVLGAHLPQSTAYLWPGASPLITMPMIVPVPLAPAVFG